MAILSVWPAKCAALIGAPPLPEGYYFGSARSTPNGARVDMYFRGARILEIAAELRYDLVGPRFAARMVGDGSSDTRTFNQTGKWVKFDDITSLIHTMLARHRIGV
jgi:hypothetical protein